MRFTLILNPEDSFFLPNFNYFNINRTDPESENLPSERAPKKPFGSQPCLSFRRQRGTRHPGTGAPIAGAASFGGFSIIFQFAEEIKKFGDVKKMSFILSLRFIIINCFQKRVFLVNKLIRRGSSNPSPFKKNEQKREHAYLDRRRN